MNMNVTKSQSMKVIPTGERKCIWMDAGVVSYKLCTSQFQCQLCEFDRAMCSRANQAKNVTKEQTVTLNTSQKKEIVEWMEEFRHLPADQRKCRYMLMGDVSYKICPNSFRCGDCTFDQMMQDRLQPSIEQDIQAFDQVAGFYMSEKLYYFRNHTWLRLERNGQYRVGIDDFAGKLIGNAASIELPPPGRNLDLEEYCWTVQHEHSDMEIFSPVKGVVTSTNRAITENTDLLTDQPYTGGWLMTVEPESIMKSNRNFLTGGEARAWMVEETNLLSKHLQTEAGATMHDGASFRKDISSSLSKENWREIVKNHLYVR